MQKSTTDRQWDKWAEGNPYLGVLGIESGAMDDAAVREKFFASGETHIADVIGRIDARLGGLDGKAAALDFGCGVGRLLRPLAKRFAAVTGVDVAARMLELSRANTAEFANVSLVSSLAEAGADGRRYDLVHSYIVLQHIRPDQGLPLIRELIGLVRPGGAFALHFTTGDSRQLRSALNWVRYRLPPVHWAYNAARRRALTEPITEMNKYDVFTILDAAKDAGCDGAFALPIDQNGHRGIMLVGKIERGAAGT